MKKEKILVWLVDDDADDRDMFEDALSEIGISYELETLKNGQLLLDKMEDSHPDILFLDVNMPILNGLKALEVIRETEKFKKIPVIIMFSTSDDDGQQHQSFDGGADAYIVKPNSYDELKALLKQAFAIDWDKRETTVQNFILFVKKGKF